jgi:CHAT domain-containing protein
MFLYKIFFALLITVGQFSQSSQIYKNNIPSFSDDTIQYLKRKSQILVMEKKYSEAYSNFTFISDFYFSHSNLRLYFDYKNKASNCYCHYANSGASLDTLIHLFNKYVNSNLNDVNLTEALINNFLVNYEKLSDFPKKLKYLDLLLCSTQCQIPIESKILLAKHRLIITNKLSFLDKEIESYYYLLNQEIKAEDVIEYEIDLGSLYSDNKDYHLSNITLQNTLCRKGLSEKNKAIIFNILGNNYLHLNNNYLSLKFYNKSLLIRNKLPNNSEYLRVIYNNIANYYNVINKMDSSLLFYELSLEISNNKYGYNSRETAFELNNIGNHYFNIGSFDSANVYYQKSFGIKNSIVNYNNIDIIHSLYNLGLTQSKLENFPSARKLLQQSIDKNFEIAKIYSLKVGPSSPNDYIFSCKNLGDLYYNSFKKCHNTYLLDSAKYYYFEAITTNDSLINSTPIESSKIRTNIANFKILESYLQCFLINNSQGDILIEDTTRILSIFDKCHNYILFNKLIDTDENPSYHFHESLNYKDKSLDEEYYTIERLEEDTSSDLNDIFVLNQSLFTKIKNMQFIGEGFDHRYNWKTNEISLSKIKESIDKHTIVLEYTTINEFLYCLSLTSNSIFVTNIGKAQQIRNLSTDYNKRLKQFSLDFEQVYILSNLLLTPLKNIPAQINKIIIIKDEDLINIPFDALLLEKPEVNLQANSYLIKDFEISYSYSINLMIENSRNFSNHNSWDFIGFAPTIFDNSKTENPNNLQGSRDEILSISKLFKNSNLKSLSLIGSDANIENFYKFAVETNILHLATHSSVSNNTSNRGFLLKANQNELYDDFDYFDVLHLTNSPNLVVIASCSSYTGNLIEGEGIRNVGRAFSIRGSSFIISSLFRLDDAFSEKFMKSFYNKLIITGNIKTSLCESKREFIYDEKYFYPSYWSNFNIIGK